MAQAKGKNNRKGKGDGDSMNKILKYSEESMNSAIAAVRDEGKKIRESARKFGVPHSMLLNKLKGKSPAFRKMGPDTILNKAEEDLICKYIVANAKKGIPIQRRTLQDTVKKILDDDKRSNPFKNNTPGRKWLQLFMKRHPVLSERNPEAISTSRAAVTEKDLRNWFTQLHNFLNEEEALEILHDPTRIFNADESGFQTCPESGKVLGPVGMKHFYQVKTGHEKEQLTVMVNISAAGIMVPPMLVYPLQRISREISNNVPLSWSIGKSQSGWMTGVLYYEYIANVFEPWLTKNNVKRPVLLLIDGHRSHLTLQVSEFCKQKQIIAYALYPNSTHITQPADVSVFKCLKSGWRRTVAAYKERSGNRQVTRAGFAPLLWQAFEEHITPDIIKNGFQACGVYPFNADRVDYSKCMEHHSRDILPVSENNGVETLLLLESMMRRGRAEQFRSAGQEWKGEESAKELFYVWKKMRERFVPSAPSNIDSEKSCVDVDRFSTLPATKSDSTPCSSSAIDISSAPSSSSAIDISSAPSSLSDAVVNKAPSSTAAVCNAPSTDLPSTASISSIANHSPATLLIISQKQKLVSPAFGDHIIWPSDSPIKSRPKERLPFATTADKWQEYWRIKDNEKRKKEERIAHKRKEREAKQKASKKLKLSPELQTAEQSDDESDSDEENEEPEPDEINHLAEGKFIIVEFFSEKHEKYNQRYVCIVQKIVKEMGEAEGMGMKSYSKDNTQFKPDESDISTINFNQIKQILPNPSIKMIGNRIVYEFNVPVHTDNKSIKK